MQVGRGVALQDRFRRDVGLLHIDAPVPQLFQRDFRAGHGAADERTGPNNAKIAVEIFDFGLAGQRKGTVGTIEQVHLRCRAARGERRVPSNIIVHAAQQNPVTFDCVQRCGAAGMLSSGRGGRTMRQS